MGRTLYLTKDPLFTQLGGQDNFAFGVTPPDPESYDDYHKLDHPISLKKDMEWEEVKHLQNIFRKAGIWENFPAEGLKFILAEHKGGDEEQRVDVLYLRDDGGIYVCELKIGGIAWEPHGQLIRYISDLRFQPMDSAWLIEHRDGYLEKAGKDGGTRTRERHKLQRYLSDNDIQDKHIHLIQKSGIIVDESFRSQVLKTVRYLNEQCGFSIRLLRMDAFADDGWDIDSERWKVRIEIVEVQ
jgi:hypothetical protein